MMKYSHLYTLLAIFFILIVWSGFPFNAIRIIITLASITMIAISIAQFQRFKKQHPHH